MAQEDFNRRHHHPAGADKALVIAKFPTAMANKENDPPGEPEHWWIINAVAVLSEPFVAYPTEEDAWEGAYITSVLGKTKEDIQVVAYYLWQAEGSPMGADSDPMGDWLDAKGELEDPSSQSQPVPVE